ncbi:hypothetical protein D3C77_99830 [compost metagenome]
MLVAQTGGADIQRCCFDQAFGIVQGTGDAQGQGLFAEELATVVQVGRRKLKSPGAGDFAAVVSHTAEVLQQQLAWCVNQATLVVQVAAIQVEGDIGQAVQTTTAMLVEAGDRGVELAVAADVSVRAVVNGAGAEGQGSITFDAALGVVQRRGHRQLQLFARRQGAFGIVVEAAEGQVKRIRAGDQAGVVEQLTADSRGQATVAAQLAATVVQAGGGEIAPLSAEQGALAVVQGTEAVDSEQGIALHQTLAVVQ